MARNTLGDLNNHLFEALERLNDESIKGDALTEEINRAEAMTRIAGQIVSNASLVLKAKKVYADLMPCDSAIPKMLEG